MKYIDAEKLIAEIKRRIENWTIRGEHSPAGQGRDTCESRVTELSDLLSFITSLQQEQPKQKKNCNDCPHCVDRKDQFGWHFKGCFGGPYNGKFIAEIDECPLQQEQPSFPSNLDEAEFEYAQSLDEIPANQEEEKMIYDAFKAGAEWMAKQGVCIPAHIFMPCEIKDVYDNSKGEYPAAIHPDCGGSLVLERYLKDFKHNEEVIVQIRKRRSNMTKEEFQDLAIDSSDIEEAAEKYAIQGHENHTNVNYINTYIEGKRIGFIAGAEWQKEQDDKLVDIIYQQGIEKGKDEMMETLKKNEK